MNRKIPPRWRCARDIFLSAVSAASPYDVVKKSLKITNPNNPLLKVDGISFKLKDFKNIYVVGAGKGVSLMAKAIEETVGDHLTSGVVVTKYGHAARLKKIREIEAGHPLPDMNGARGASEILKLARSAGKDDLVICLLTGGASALLPAPAQGINLTEKKKLTGLLIKSGASIDEINAVRKHISSIKGGRLLEAANPARLITLVISDVVGDSLSTIASGPTAPDTTAYSDAIEVLNKYGLIKKTPPSIISLLKKGERGDIKETPKPGARFFKKCDNLIISSNRSALGAASSKARALGFNTIILTSQLCGNTREAARFFISILKEIKKTGNPVRPPACLLMGGETTLKVAGKGVGGRNQEFALVSAIELSGTEGITVLSAGTDGTDGPTEAAGAFADSLTLRRAEAKGLWAKQYLENNDSYSFFNASGGLFITGPTGTNVMDVVVGVVE